MALKPLTHCKSISYKNHFLRTFCTLRRKIARKAMISLFEQKANARIKAAHSLFTNFTHSHRAHITARTQSTQSTAHITLAHRALAHTCSIKSLFNNSTQ